MLEPSNRHFEHDADPPNTSTEKYVELKGRLFAFGDHMVQGAPAKKAANRGSQQQAAYRMALSMNQIQDRYHDSLFVVGGQGRLFAERALDAIFGIQSSNDKTLCAKIQRARTERRINTPTNDALHKLRELGNKTAHNKTVGFCVADKPAVVDNVCLVAAAVLQEPFAVPAPTPDVDLKHYLDLVARIGLIENFSLSSRPARLGHMLVTMCLVMLVMACYWLLAMGFFWLVYDGQSRACFLISRFCVWTILCLFPDLSFLFLVLFSLLVSLIDGSEWVPPQFFGSSLVYFESIGSQHTGCPPTIHSQLVCSQLAEVLFFALARGLVCSQFAFLSIGGGVVLYVLTAPYK